MSAPTPRRSWAPSIPALAFLLVAIAAIMMQSRMLNIDGDLARHIRHGETILRTGRVIRTDAFSYTHVGRPFVGFEYGMQVALAAAHRAAGLPGVLALAAMVLGAAYSLMAHLLMRRGVEPLLVLAAVIAAILIGQIHWVARPHIVSFLLLVLMLDWLERDRDVPLWYFPVLFVAWANLHPLWILGLVVIGAYAVGHAADYVLQERSGDGLIRARHLAAAGALALAATFVTPYGADLHRYILDFLVHEGFIRDVTAEFQSPNFHAPVAKPFLFALLGLLALLPMADRRMHPTRLLLVLGLTYMSLTAQRNITIFAVLAIPVLALHADRTWRERAPLRRLRAEFERGAQVSTTTPWTVGAAAMLFILASNQGRLLRAQILPVGFDRRVFPVEATTRAREAGLTGNMFHEFTWGGYFLYAWPEQRIVIDGGTEFFGVEHVKKAIDVLEVNPGWREQLENWRVTIAIMRTKARLTEALAHEPGWAVWYCDGTATIFTKGPAADTSLSSNRLAICRTAADSAERAAAGELERQQAVSPRR